MEYEELKLEIIFFEASDVVTDSPDPEQDPFEGGIF